MTQQIKALATLTMALAVLTGCDNTAEAREMDRARAQVSMCWNGQPNRSVGAGAAPIVEGTCERLEGEFKERFHQSP